MICTYRYSLRSAESDLTSGLSHPDKRPHVKRRLKALGCKPFTPTTQTVGILSGHALTEDIEHLAKLAFRYEYEGQDKIVLCSRNAAVSDIRSYLLASTQDFQAAFDVGKHDAAQTWLLLASLLTDVVPQTTNTPAITLSPLPILNPKLPHSVSAPATIPANTQDSVTPILTRPYPASLQLGASDYTSPGSKSTSSSIATSRRGSEKSRTKSTSSTGTGFLSPLRTTPASSTTPSPRRPTDPLPPLSSSLSTAVIAARYPSSAGLPPTFGSVTPTPSSLHSRLGSHRKSSFKGSTLSNLAAVGESRSFSHHSLKHVGEGALDDSDSETSESEHNPQSSIPNDAPFIEEESVEIEIQHHAPRSRRSPSGSTPNRWHSRASSVQPSPLSRIAVQETWTEDERDEDDSPSPASTDSEMSSEEPEAFASPGFHPPHPLSRRQSSSRSRRSSMRSSKKSRSRSSTVASLSVSLPPSAMSSRSRLVRNESTSSIKTVTASQTPVSTHAPGRAASGERGGSSTPHRDVSIRDTSTSTTRSDAVSLRSGSYYNRSRPLSEAPLNEDTLDLNGVNPNMRRALNSTATTISDNAAREAIREAETRLREAGWEAMKESFEILVDDVSGMFRIYMHSCC